MAQSPTDLKKLQNEKKSERSSIKIARLWCAWPARGALQVVRGLLQPSGWNRSQAADHRGKLGRLHDAGSHNHSDFTVGGLNRHRLKVRILASVLLGSAKLPLPRVTVTNVLRVVSDLSADLTNLGHGSIPSLRRTRAIRGGEPKDHTPPPQQMQAPSGVFRGRFVQAGAPCQHRHATKRSHHQHREHARPGNDDPARNGRG